MEAAPAAIAEPPPNPSPMSSDPVRAPLPHQRHCRPWPPALQPGGGLCAKHAVSSMHLSVSCGPQTDGQNLLVSTAMSTCMTRARGHGTKSPPQKRHKHFLKDVLPPHVQDRLEDDVEPMLQGDVCSLLLLSADDVSYYPHTVKSNTSQPRPSRQSLTQSQKSAAVSRWLRLLCLYKATV